MSAKPIKTCTDRSPQIVPVNAPFAPTATPAPPESLSAVLLINKKWQNGQILSCAFLDGEPVVQRKVESMAHIWSRYANIRFKFIDEAAAAVDPAAIGNADIRISFQQQGSWSYIGTDARLIGSDQPTMNFGWLRPETADEEYNRVVVHEFGHALGLAHEHQNPDNGIPWNRPAVYEYYQGPPNYWTPAQVDVNLFQRYAEDQVRFTGFDPASIMLYPVPNEFTIGDFEIGWNSGISPTDGDFIGRMYPKPSNELLLDDQPRVESISSFGEIDTFTFLIFEPGRYRIETDGRTDLVMMLYGPEDDTKFIAMDDDSGRRLNPRIVEELDWGLYTVRIQHFSNRRTGDYAIGVYTA